MTRRSAAAVTRVDVESRLEAAAHLLVASVFGQIDKDAAAFGALGQIDRVLRILASEVPAR
jgi:hypothetical protein